MKILQLTRDYIQNGGIGIYVRNLTTLLETTGHDVAVICSERPAEDGPTMVERIAGFDEFEHDNARANRERVLATATSFGPDVILIHAMDDFELERLLRRQYSVARFVHNHIYCSSGIDHDTSPLRPCERLQGPACVAGYLTRRCWNTSRPSTAVAFYRRATAAVSSLQASEVIFAASDYVRGRILQHGVAPERVILAPYFPGVPGLPSDSLQLRPDGHTLLFVGRVLLEKGLDYLLRSLPDISGPWRLIVDGDGPALENAIALARRLRLLDRIEFAGWSSREQHLTHYETADVVVVPSVWPEPFGLVGIEAMAYGKPVVAFRTGGIPDWLAHEETGFLVENGNAVELGQRIGELLADPQLRLRMGRAARDRALDKFSPGRHLAAIEHGLSLAIQQPPDGRLQGLRCGSC